MHRLKRLLQLPRHQRRLLFLAFWALLVSRVSLLFMPLSKVRRLVARSAAAPQGVSINEVAWAVAGVSSIVPRANCLCRAVAVEAMLRNAGHQPTIEFGVAKDPTKAFEGHAWVRCDNRVVIGGPDTEQYAALKKI
jgi:hypothetical protein